MTTPSKESWPHSPPHWLFEPGIYMVTAGTFNKELFFCTPESLDLLQNLLFSLAREFGWTLQAWAILGNHYHFVAQSPRENAATLTRMISKLHTLSARELNRCDNIPGRKVWFQFWDSQITFQASHLARLRYVHQNPVHHGVASEATTYRWCSAAWFERSAPSAFVKTVNGFKTDRVRVVDAF